MTVVEEYAIWLAHTGVDESAQDDLNEGCDPVSERGGEVSEEDWRAAMKLAHDIAGWIRASPETVLAQVRAAQKSPACSCPRFKDTGGYRIADLACPVHGVNGTDPGDGRWDDD